MTFKIDPRHRDIAAAFTALCEIVLRVSVAALSLEAALSSTLYPSARVSCLALAVYLVAGCYTPFTVYISAAHIVNFYARDDEEGEEEDGGDCDNPSLETRGDTHIDLRDYWLCLLPAHAALRSAYEGATDGNREYFRDASKLMRDAMLGPALSQWARGDHRHGAGLHED